MSILDRLFGRKKPASAAVPPEETDPTLLLTGAKYWMALDLDRYGFSKEEHDLICEYYDMWRRSPTDCPVRPMGLEEQKQYQEALDLEHICLLWTDDESNAVGVYHSCPLQGKVMFLVHDDPLYAPLFRSVGSFLQGLENGVVEDRLWLPSLVHDRSNYLADYPAREMDKEEAAANLEMVQEFLAQAEAEEDAGNQAHLVLIAAYLTPPENLDLLLPLLEAESRYFQQDLPYIFYFHRYEPAMPILQQMAVTGGAFLKGSAKRILELTDRRD